MLVRLPYYRWLVVGTVCIGAFMGQVDSSIAQLLLPRLEYDFGARLSTVSWVAVAYLITMAAFLPIFGRIADIVGRKLLNTGGFLLFVLGSGLCGLASNLPMLISFRVIQAIGAALLASNSVAIVVTVAGPEQRGRALGIQAAAQAVGLSLGPMIGGLVLATLNWRWVFWINVPFGLAASVIGWFVIPPTADISGKGRFDWKGALLILPALAAFIALINEAHVWGVTSPLFLGGGLVTVVFMFLFLCQERGNAEPLINFSLFRINAFWAGNVAALMSYANLFGLFFLMPFVFIRIYHDNVLIAGVRLAIVPATLGLIAPISGTLSDRIGTRILTISGMVFCSIGLLLLYFTIDGNVDSLPTVMAALAIFGFGMGLFASPNNNAIMAAAPPHMTGTAGGLMNVIRSLGMSIGISASAALMSSRLSTLTGRIVNTIDVSPDILLHAGRGVILLLIDFAAVGGLLSFAGVHAQQLPASTATSSKTA